MTGRLPRKFRMISKLEKGIFELREQEKIERKELKKQADIYQKVDVNVAYDYSMSHFEEVRSLPSEEAFEQWLNQNNFRVDNINRGKIWFAIQQKSKEQSQVVPEPVKEEVPAQEEENPIDKKEEITADNSSSLISKFWVVTKKVSDASTLADILWESSPEKIGLQFEGGLKNHEIIGFYNDYTTALKEAEKVLNGQEGEDVEQPVENAEPLPKPDTTNDQIKSSSVKKEAADKGELKEKQEVIQDSTGLKGNVSRLFEEKGFVEVKWEDGRVTMVPLTDVEPFGKEEKQRKKVFEGNPDELKPTKLHDKNPSGEPLKNKPKGLEVPERVTPATEDITIAYEDFREAQRHFADLQGKIENIRKDAQAAIVKLQTDENYPGLQKKVEQSVNILSSIMEKENLAITQLGEKLIALEKGTEKEKVKTNAEVIADLQKKIQAMNDQILQLSDMAEPIAKDIDKRILHIWEKTRDQKRDEKVSSTKVESADEDVLSDLGGLYEALRSLYLNTKGIVSEI